MHVVNIQKDGVSCDLVPDFPCKDYFVGAYAWTNQPSEPGASLPIILFHDDLTTDAVLRVCSSRSSGHLPSR